ncbi:hypothetical protein BV898_15261 [Hypsibius exemplaris]|uniref:Uncharacterized protein n=1 Tax=Hypsibius exemplaris TaxID=2072580 RepID=A0A9X6NB78_HYPEX|nr:hypothetical protein BV898_15261 [Hypsibius exemplaris]
MGFVNQTFVDYHYAYCAATVNFSNASSSHYYPDHFSSAEIIWRCVIGVLCIFGTVSNVTVLFVVISVPKLRIGAGFFIALLLATYLALSALSFRPWTAFGITATLTLTASLPGVFEVGTSYQMSPQGLCNFLILTPFWSFYHSFHRYVLLLPPLVALLAVVKIYVKSHISGRSIHPDRPWTIVRVRLQQRRREVSGMLGLSFGLALLCQFPLITTVMATPLRANDIPIMYCISAIDSDSVRAVERLIGHAALVLCVRCTEPVHTFHSSKPGCNVERNVERMLLPQGQPQAVLMHPL